MLGLACVTTCVVFLVNLIFAIIMTRKNGLAAVVPLYEGSCSWWKRIDTGLHILINVLSTLLLGASNLCMQLLAAPTRKEVEIAHGKGVWLDIGVPSWRNLWRIEPQRSVIWWILALSSIPINFMYVPDQLFKDPLKPPRNPLSNPSRMIGENIVKIFEIRATSCELHFCLITP